MLNDILNSDLTSFTEHHTQDEYANEIHYD